MGRNPGFQEKTQAVRPGLCFLSYALVAGQGRGTGVTCTVPSAPCPELAVFPNWVGWSRACVWVPSLAGHVTVNASGTESVL